SIGAGPIGSEGFDLGKELADEMNSLELPPEPRPTAVPQQLTPIAVQGELAQFRKAVDETIGADDSATHFDLALAYKGMGLYDEAIQAFEKALQASGRRRVVDCLIMIGACQLERGDAAAALPRFETASRRRA